MNKLLLRQIQKALGGPEKLSPELKELFRIISDSYDHHEKDRKMIERSLELSSREMVELNGHLKKESEQVTMAHQELRMLFENIDEVFFSVDVENRQLLQISIACHKVYGYTPTDFFTSPSLMKEIVLEEDRKIVAEQEKKLRNGHSVIYVNRIRHKNGDIRWIETKITPTLNANKRLVRTDGVASDITERKNAEVRLQESEAQIKAIFNAAPDAIIILNEQGEITRWDSKSENLFGWTQEEVLGKRLSEVIIPARLRNAHEEHLGKILQLKKSQVSGKTTEVRAVDRNNREFDISLSISPSFVKNNYSFIGFIRDITEKKHAQELIQSSEKRFRSLIENNEDAICLTDASHHFIYVSPAVQRMTGFLPEENLNKKIWTHIHQDDLEKCEKLFAELEKNPFVPFPFQVRILHKDGHYIWIEGTLNNLLPDSSVNAIVANYRDITKRKQAENAIQQSESKYRDLFEQMLDGVYKSSGSGKFLDVNPAMVKMLGYDSKEELLSIDIKSQLYFNTSDRDNAVQQDNAEGRAVFRLKKKDGNEIWVEDRGRYILDENGKPMFHEGILRDVTKRIYTENQLRRSERETADYKKALDQSLIVAITDQSGIIRYANENFCRISKYKAKELTGCDHRILSSSYHSEDFMENMFATVSRGEVWRNEVKNKAKDGSYYWVDTTIVPFLNEDNEPYQYLSISVDITERKLAEESLLANERKFRSLIENSADMISMMDATGKFTYVSPEIVKRFEFSFEECMQMRALDIIHPIDANAYQKLMTEVLMSPSVPIAGPIIRNKRKDGSYLWVEGTITNLLTLDGVNAIVTNFRDITQRKEQQDALEKTNAELTKSNKELDQFVYSISHDLRAPLLSMLGIVDITASESKETLICDHMDMLKGSIGRLDHFISEILAYSKNARCSLARNVIHFRTLLDEVIDGLPAACEQNGVEISTEIRGSATFCSDKDRLTVILNNLLSNSVTYINPNIKKHTVKVLVETNDSMATIIVEDNGIGISEEYQQKVFEMFYRISEASTGSGLGLYIVKETIDKLKGTIEVESVPGSGTRFIIQIPNQFYQ